MAWDGKPRRVDDNPESVQVRLALLERAAADAERRHNENKDSLIAVHRRITDFGKEFTISLEKGIDAIIDKMDSEKKARDKDCKAHQEELQAVKDDLATVSNNQVWVIRWLGSAWAVIAAGFGLMLHHGAKH